MKHGQSAVDSLVLSAKPQQALNMTWDQMRCHQRGMEMQAAKARALEALLPTLSDAQKAIVAEHLDALAASHLREASQNNSSMVARIAQDSLQPGYNSISQNGPTVHSEG